MPEDKTKKSAEILDQKPTEKPNLVLKNQILIAIVGTLIFVSLLLGGVLYYQSFAKNRNDSELVSNQSSNQTNSGPQSISQISSQKSNSQSGDFRTSSTKSSSTDSAKSIVSEFDNYRIKLEKIVAEKDPSTALRQLNQDITSIKVVQENCHSFTHLIGNAALVKYDNNITKAMEQNVDICGGGYIHGIIEEYIHKNPEAAQNLINVCPDENDGTCLHALGHGLMLLYEFDVFDSVSDCKKLNSFKAQVYCGEGVFMENFDSENAPDSAKPFLKASDPFFPCDQFLEPYKNTCYYYSGRYLLKQNQDPKNALQKCLELNNYAHTCVRGMSAGILRSNFDQPNLMESICETVPNQKLDCFKGAVDYHLLMLDSQQKTKQNMCDKFVEEANQNTCNNLIKSSPFGK